MIDDYLLDDEDDEDIDSKYEIPGSSDVDEDEGDGPENEEDDRGGKVSYEGLESKMTDSEIKMSQAYDEISNATKLDSTDAINTAARAVISNNPKHTSVVTVGYKVMELFSNQGHARVSGSVFTPGTMMTAGDLGDDFNHEDAEINEELTKNIKEQIARFIDYLAKRDLSKDSVISKKRKLRHIPAFIIYLFSSNLYDYILNCPTMPKEYSEQIENAMKTITKIKYNVVDDLAKKYEEKGRSKVADRVRKLQFAWFEKEPAEIRGVGEYSDLDLTLDDVKIYKEYRNKFTNASRNITQELAADLIEVVLEDGVYEKLKDRTKADAIADVKQVYRDWAKNSPIDSDLANKIIWKQL